MYIVFNLIGAVQKIRFRLPQQFRITIYSATIFRGRKCQAFQMEGESVHSNSLYSKEFDGRLVIGIRK